MGEVPRSLHLDAALMERLENEARQQELPADELARQAIEHFLEVQSVERDALAARIAEADKGEFISAEAMLDWMGRLETDPNALPPEVDTFFPPKA